MLRSAAAAALADEVSKQKRLSSVTWGPLADTCATWRSPATHVTHVTNARITSAAAGAIHTLQEHPMPALRLLRCNKQNRHFVSLNALHTVSYECA